MTGQTNGPSGKQSPLPITLLSCVLNFSVIALMLWVGPHPTAVMAVAGTMLVLNGWLVHIERRE